MKATGQAKVCEGCSFCAELRGEPEGSLWPPPAHLPKGPRIVAEGPRYVALPSLGPIVPGHMLIVPRSHCQSMSAAIGSIRNELIAFAHQVSDAMETAYGQNPLLFEHGAAEGSLCKPCTVGHAHWHLVPAECNPKDLCAAGEDWQEVDTPFVVSPSDYLMVGRLGGPYWVLHATAAMPSQLLRRRVAERMGIPDRNDWRITPDAQCVQKTMADLRPLLGSGSLGKQVAQVL